MLTRLAPHSHVGGGGGGSAGAGAGVLEPPLAHAAGSERVGARSASNAQSLQGGWRNARGGSHGVRHVQLPSASSSSPQFRGHRLPTPGRRSQRRGGGRAPFSAAADAAAVGSHQRARVRPRAGAAEPELVVGAARRRMLLSERGGRDRGEGEGGEAAEATMRHGALRDAAAGAGDRLKAVSAPARAIVAPRAVAGVCRGAACTMQPQFFPNKGVLALNYILMLQFDYSMQPQHY